MQNCVCFNKKKVILILLPTETTQEKTVAKEPLGTHSI